MDPLSRLSDAARAMRREVTRGRVAAAFAVPDVDARRAAAERVAGAVAKHRDAVGEETWARFEAALAEAAATGECDALTDAIDALETERTQGRTDVRVP